MKYNVTILMRIKAPRKLGNIVVETVTENVAVSLIFFPVCACKKFVSRYKKLGVFTVKDEQMTDDICGRTSRLKNNKIMSALSPW